MKARGVAVFFVLLGALWAVSAQAAELKIGAVSIGKILNEAPQAEQANKRLQQEFAPREKGLVDAQKSLRGLEERLAKDGAVMSDSQRRSLERDVRAQARELQRATEEFREDVNLRRNEELSKFQQEVVEVINTLAKEENFDLILSEGSVLYAGERVDITQKILNKLSR